MSKKWVRPALILMLAVLCSCQSNSTNAGTTATEVSGQYDDGQPSWSPSGDTLAFTRFLSETDAEIWLVNLSNNTFTDLTTSEGWVDRRPAWSPDGSKIAFLSNRTGIDTLWIMDADGETEINLLPDINAYDQQSPIWSPDGTQLVFVSSNEDGLNQVSLVDLDGENLRTIPFEGQYSAEFMAWSSDGTFIAVCASHPDGVVLGRINVATGEFSIIDTGSSTEVSLRVGGISWSRSLDSIAFTASGNGGLDVWLINADGTQLRNITGTNTYQDFIGIFSPDGNRIAFQSISSNESVAIDIRVASADGRDVINLTATVEGAPVETVWSPDGSRIAVPIAFNYRSSIWILSADGTAAQNLTGS